MHKDLDAVETKVVEILKDFNDQMKKLFGEAQNMCSVSLQEYRPQFGSPSPLPERKAQPSFHTQTLRQTTASLLQLS